MEEKEYNFTIDFEIGISGECLGKLKLAELKKKLKKEIEDFFEKEANVSEYDIWQMESDTDYEELE